MKQEPGIGWGFLYILLALPICFAVLQVFDWLGLL